MTTDINEAIDLPPDPPAIVYNIDQGSPTFSSRFIDYIKTAENGIKSGYKHGKWYPIRDPNGKFNVIAYGHKIASGVDTFDKGITDKQADELLMQDLRHSWDKADKWLKSKYGKGMNSLPRRSQEMLVDYSFNPGSLGVFPKFVDAVVRGDLETMKQEYKRSFVDASGQRKEMGRNALFANLFLTGT